MTTPTPATHLPEQTEQDSSRQYYNKVFGLLTQSVPVGITTSFSTKPSRAERIWNFPQWIPIDPTASYSFVLISRPHFTRQLKRCWFLSRSYLSLQADPLRRILQPQVADVSLAPLGNEGGSFATKTNQPKNKN